MPRILRSHIRILIEAFLDCFRPMAAYIIHLQYEQEGAETLNLVISRGDLSKILGTTQESLSRVFMRITDAGIIALDNCLF